MLAHIGPWVREAVGKDDFLGKLNMGVIFAVFLVFWKKKKNGNIILFTKCRGEEVVGEFS